MRKPLGTVFHEFITEELEKSGLSQKQFGQNLDIKSTTLSKLLLQEEPGLHSTIMDRILTNTGVSMVELLSKYGEYEE